MRIGEMKDSKYIKKEDVGEKGKVLTVKELKNENVAGENAAEEMKWILYFNEAQKGVVLNWTNIQMTAKICGSEDSDDWTGKKVELYEDPTIGFGGKIVGGIRIRKPSGQTEEAVPSGMSDLKSLEGSDIDPDIPF